MKMAALMRYVFIVMVCIVTTGVLFFCQSNEKNGNASSSKTGNENKKTASVNTGKSNPGIDSAGIKNNTQNSRQLIVYYLHGTFRCPSCNTIERLTKQAVEQGFADQISKGRIQLKILNIEEPGNEHFVLDYKLYTKSVILSDLKDDKEVQWKNLEKVWTLLHDEVKFIEYIQSEVKNFL
jgi:cell division protein YceG involved in septum cleavage